MNPLEHNSRKAEIAQLAKVFRFTGKDLHYNRNGVVSKEQFKQFRSDLNVRVIAFGVGTVLFGSLGIIRIPSFFTDGWVDNTAIILGFGLFLPLGLAYWFIKAILALNYLQKGTVHHYSGQIFKEQIEYRPTAFRIKVGDSAYEFFMQLGDKKFKVAKDEYEIIKKGRSYNAYYLPNYRILSIEPCDSIDLESSR